MQPIHDIQALAEAEDFDNRLLDEVANELPDNTQCDLDHYRDYIDGTGVVSFREIDTETDANGDEAVVMIYYDTTWKLDTQKGWINTGMVIQKEIADTA